MWNENCSKGIAFILMAGALGLFPLWGCVQTPDGPQPATGAALWELITVTDPYEAWAQFPEAQGTIDSAPPHGPFANVFINAAVESAIGNFTGQLPENSIIVKESFDENRMESGDSITVMWKVPGFNSANNDWFFGRFEFDGTIRAEGNIAGCASCHGAQALNDFIFLQQFE